jgi:hypothetical protein
VAPKLETLEAAKNLPPVIERILPERFNRFDVVLVVGREHRFTIDARDPEGMPLTVTLLGLPEGAEFSEGLRTVNWAPTPGQRGEHMLRVVVSDGTRETSRLMSLRVVDNRPPQFSREARVFYVGEYGTVSLGATDLDQDRMTFTASGIPGDARFDPDSASLSWRPTEADLGEHVVHVTASDGSLEATEDLSVRVERMPGQATDEDEWESFFLPGAGYSLYMPRQSDESGLFRGPTLEILMGAWIHRNPNRGPSHGRVYVNVELHESTKADVPVLFTYAVGFSLSLERNPRRSWLIPNYGADIGGMMQDDLGSHFQSTPYLGLHLYSSPNMFVTARAGYRLVPANLEELGGAHFSLAADLSVW